MDKWSLRDVVLLAFLAFLFGGVFMGADAIYALLAAALTPIGYAPFANEILFGMWVMAAPMTAMLLKKKGSSILGECLAALAEMLYGSYFGPAVLLSGFVQGLGSEAGFIVTRYRRYDTV
ncbi:ABC-type cobalt transport system, permease component family protein, partial [Lacticaseibacillus paracasei subsp. paracasei Lpp219]